MDNTARSPARPPARPESPVGVILIGRTLLLVGLALALLLVVLGIVFAWPIARAVGEALAGYSDLIALGLLAFAALLAVAVVRIAFAYGARAWALARQATIVRLQNDQPVSLGDVRERGWGLAEHGLGLHYLAEQARAERSQYANLTTLHNAPRLHIAGATEITPETESPAPQPVGDADWRDWMDRAPHLLIAGRTDAGKTTLATALLVERALSGDQVLVLDPHYQPGKWAGVPAIGGGGDFEAILGTLPLLIREMMLRYGEFERGRLTEDFGRLTVLIDEVPAIVDACMETMPSGRPRIKDPRWAKFARRLGSEARKVRISVILMAQSTLVQDILINVQQRENYLRVALGDRARSLLNEEPDRRRRQQLDELLRGQSHPAAMEWKGDFHLLDTSAVPDLARRPIGRLAEVWTPPPPPSLPHYAAPAAAQIPPTTPIPAAPLRPVPPTERLSEPVIKEQIVDLLRVRQEWMTATEIAAALSANLGTVRNQMNPLERSRAIVRRPVQREVSEEFEYAHHSLIHSFTSPVALSA